MFLGGNQRSLRELREMCAGKIYIFIISYKSTDIFEMSDYHCKLYWTFLYKMISYAKYICHLYSVSGPYNTSPDSLAKS